MSQLAPTHYFKPLKLARLQDAITTTMRRSPRGDRSILPSTSDTPTNVTSLAWAPLQRGVSKRRIGTKVACESCRGRKSACDGRRPACSRCIHDRRHCVYVSRDEEETHFMAKRREIEEHKDVIRDYETVISLLQSASEDEAHGVLRRLRTASSVQTFLDAEKRDRLPPSMQQTEVHPVPRPPVSADAPSSEITTRSADLIVAESQSTPESAVYDSYSHAEPLTIDPSLLYSDQPRAHGFNQTDPALSQTVVQQLRIGQQPQDFLNLLRGEARMNISPSQLRTALSITPPIRSPRELHLLLNHPAVYPRLDLNELGRSTNTSPEFGASTSLSGQDRAIADHASTFSRSGNESEHTSPVQSPAYFDAGLDELDIGFWTSVPVASSFAAEVISAYLATDHPVLGLFEPAVFLSGLLHHDASICSPFEVNALLAFISQPFAQEPSLAASYGDQFKAEAERHWRVDRDTDSPAGMVGLCCLFLFYGINGQGEMARARLQDIVEMAKRMDLFGTAKHENTEDISGLPPTLRRAMAYAGWGAFNLVSMQSLFWDVEFPQYAPSLPIPEAEPSGTPLSAAVGSTFTACCKFWNLTHEFLLVYHSGRNQQHLSLAFSLSSLQKLLNWADSLPASLGRSNTAAGHVMVFHIWLHAIILHMFRPFVSDPKQYDLDHWSPHSSPAEAIFSTSVKKLKNLVLAYLKNVSRPWSMLWHVALIYVANAVVKNPSDPEWRFYFLLCVFTYRDIAPTFPMAEGIAQGLLAIAIEQGLFTPAEAALHMGQFKPQTRREAEQESQGGFILDLDAAVTDRDAAQVDVLVQRFNEVKVTSEWTKDVF